MMEGRVMVSQDGITQLHYQVVENDTELDTDRIMVPTAIDLDPVNIIAWLMKPCEHAPVNENTRRDPRDTTPEDLVTSDRHNIYPGMEKSPWIPP